MLLCFQLVLTREMRNSNKMFRFLPLPRRCRRPLRSSPDPLLIPAHALSQASEWLKISQNHRAVLNKSQKKQTQNGPMIRTLSQLLTKASLSTLTRNALGRHLENEAFVIAVQSSEKSIKSMPTDAKSHLRLLFYKQLFSNI